jgi:hypothetical protein
VTGLNRKYLIRVLNHPLKPRLRKRRKRRAEYGAAVVTALIEVWDIFEQPCGQRLAAVLRSELDRPRKLGELHCSDVVAGQLERISASTMDRLLGREKRARHLRRNRVGSTAIYQDCSGQCHFLAVANTYVDIHRSPPPLLHEFHHELDQTHPFTEDIARYMRCLKGRAHAFDVAR